HVRARVTRRRRGHPTPSTSQAVGASAGHPRVTGTEETSMDREKDWVTDTPSRPRGRVALSRRAAALPGVRLVALLLRAGAAAGWRVVGPGRPSASPSTTTRGGTVVDGLAEEPDTLLPMLTNETYAVIVDQSLWAPLWYGDTTGALHAGLADLPSQDNGK